MKQIQKAKPAKPTTPPAQDLRTPSGRPMPF
jgi:hypothetical protein